MVFQTFLLQGGYRPLPGRGLFPDPSLRKLVFGCTVQSQVFFDAERISVIERVCSRWSLWIQHSLRHHRKAYFFDGDPFLRFFPSELRICSWSSPRRHKARHTAAKLVFFSICFFGNLPFAAGTDLWILSNCRIRDTPVNATVSRMTS